MHTIEERIKEAIRLSDCKTRKAFSELIGVTPDALKKWERRGAITAAGILKITAKVPMSRTYLEKGTGDAELTESGTSNYGNDDRAGEVVEMYKMLDSEDQEIVYRLINRLSSAADDVNLKF